MHIAVCICTRHRVESLIRTLESINACDRGSFSVEILVVANEADGETKAALGRYLSQLPLIVIEEPVAGISRARNAALNFLRQNRDNSVFVMSVDDDVTVHSRWLSKMAETSLRYGDRYIFGGRIIPVLPEECRTAFARHLVGGKFKSPMYADYQPESETAETQEIPFGPNYAFSLSSAAEINYSTEIGCGAEISSLGEETKFLQDITKTGYKIVYCHEAVVNHHIRPEQLSEEWLLKRAEMWAVTELDRRVYFQSRERYPELKREYKKRLFLHGIAEKIFFWSLRLRIGHSIRIRYYRIVIQAIENSGNPG